MQASGMTSDDLDRLRAQLVDMRAALVEKLLTRIDGSALALLASVNGALRAVDDMTAEDGGEP